MKIFAPHARAYSFVDNMTLTARNVALVAQGHFAMVTFSALCGLSMDEEKTYVWGLTAPLRKGISQLGFPCLQDASELGASMTFGAKIRNRIMKAKGTGMEDKWNKLRRSMAPFLQKLNMLPKVFWPRALHGSPACVFSDQYLLSLRRAATKALNISGAGSNPTLRLSLSGEMKNDPGFYQLSHCVATLRRLMRKSTDLLQMWKTWQEQYHGKTWPGPFTKITLCLNQIGWRVTTPPFVMDHEQHAWNLLTLDDKTLHGLLEDAWCQHVAWHTKHKTMEDLHGMDRYLTTYQVNKLMPLERSLLSALQSGAFVSTSEHSKYDAEKTPFCTICECENDRAHWLLCPRFRHLRADIEDWHADNVELPACALYHLLIPRVQKMVDWRHTLHQLQDCSKVFHVYPPKVQTQHLFTDGTCTMPKHPCLRMAAWGVVCSTTGDVVALGHLHGQTQSIDRAELVAVIAAVQWSQEADIYVWSDSLSTVTTAEYIQEHRYVPISVENQDLWLELWDALLLRDGLVTCFRWVPSHIEQTLADDPFESWAIHWNGVVDDLVSQWNFQRPAAFLQQHEDLARTLDWWCERIQQLSQFYFKVAAMTSSASNMQETLDSEVIEIESDEGGQRAPELLADLLPLTWQVKCRQTPAKVPGIFVESLLQWICAAEQIEQQPFVFSELELVFILIDDDSFLFPFQLDGTVAWTMKRLVDLFHRPTLVTLLRPIQIALQQLEALFPGVFVQTPKASAPELGVHKQFKGLCACIPRL